MPLGLAHEEWIEHLYEKKTYFPIYFSQLAQAPNLYGFGPWLIIEKQSKSIIGDIGFKGYPNHATVDLGYGIIPSKQRNGYATEATNALCAWAFQTGIVNRITATCFDWNIASITVLKKCQFKAINKNENMIYWQMMA